MPLTQANTKLLELQNRNRDPVRIGWVVGIFDNVERHLASRVRYGLRPSVKLSIVLRIEIWWKVLIGVNVEFSTRSSSSFCKVWNLTTRDHFWLVYTYQLNPPLGTAKTDRHITNRKCLDSGVHGQFDRSNLLWKMTVGGVPPPAYFDCRGSFRAGLPFFFQDDFEMRRPLLHNLTHPEYPITPEAAQRLLQD
ncbi:hypothetical protein J6590_064302 [Homalodisca vitripennis]|nr:hypothetical protein J6590_064302 [Homalodisca vitripennis]